MNAEQKHIAIQEASFAGRELESAIPSIHEHIQKQFRRIKNHMAQNDEVLSPDFAVQAWYAVFAVLELEESMKRVVRKGLRAAKP